MLINNTSIFKLGIHWHSLYMFIVNLVHGMHGHNFRSSIYVGYAL